MADETVEWQPAFLDVDPVYGMVFARFCEQYGVRLPSLSFILCSYEFVSITHRRILERVFHVPVFDLYGSTETGHLLMEDVSGQMRPSLGTAVLEVINADADGIGELAVTTLTNDFMPLIRYRIGDLVQREEKPYGTRYVLHGRVADAFLEPSGRRVTTRQLDQCFAGIDGIAHYQLLEHATSNWSLRIVADQNGPTAEAVSAIQCRLARLLYPADKIQVEVTDLLMPEPSGKFRLGYPRTG
jgi:phenylacetate-CoA ligase